MICFGFIWEAFDEFVIDADGGPINGGLIVHIDVECEFEESGRNDSLQCLAPVANMLFNMLQ